MNEGTNVWRINYEAGEAKYMGPESSNVDSFIEEKLKLPKPPTITRDGIRIKRIRTSLNEYLKKQGYALEYTESSYRITFKKSSEAKEE